MTEPLVSVIVPCYNTARFVAEAIDSALAQTLADLEVVVVDDGSTDNSAEIVKAYTDSRVRYVHQANRGLAGARNTGIRNARGRYLSFLDADDTMLPEKLAKQAAFLEADKGYGLVAGGYHRTDEEGRLLYVERRPAGDIAGRDVVLRSQFPVNVVLVRRDAVEAVGLFDESFRRAEDWDLFCRLAIAGCRMARTTDIVATYRVTKGSLSASAERQTEALLAVTEKTFGNPLLPVDWMELRDEALGFQHLFGAGRGLLAGEHDHARRHLTEALRLQPTYGENGAAAVAKSLGSWSQFVPPEERERFIQSAIQLLPGEVPANKFERHLRQYLERQKLTDLWRRRHWPKFLPLALAYAARHPADLVRLARRK